MICRHADIFHERSTGEDSEVEEGDKEEKKTEQKKKKKKKKTPAKKKSKKEANQFSGKITLADLKGKEEEVTDELDPLDIDEAEDDAGNIFYSVYRKLGGKHDKKWVRDYCESYPSRLNGHKKGTQLKLIKHPDGGECSECGIDLTSRWRKNQETCQDKDVCNSCYWNKDTWERRTIHWPNAFRGKLPDNVIICPRGGGCEYCRDEPFNDEAEEYGASTELIENAKKNSAKQEGKKRKRVAPKETVDSEEETKEEEEEGEDDKPKKKKKRVSRKKTTTIIIEDDDDVPQVGKECTQCHNMVRFIKGTDFSKPLCQECFDSQAFRVPSTPINKPPPSLPSSVTGPWVGMNLTMQDVTSSPALEPTQSEWGNLLPLDVQPMIIDPNSIEWLTEDLLGEGMVQEQNPYEEANAAAELERLAAEQRQKEEEANRQREEEESKKQMRAKSAEDRLARFAEDKNKRRLVKLEQEKEKARRLDEERAELRKLEEETKRLRDALSESKKLAEAKSLAATVEVIRLAEEKILAEAEASRLAEEKRLAEAEAYRLAEVETTRLAEEKRLAEVEATRLAEEKRLAEEVARIAETNRLAEESKRLQEEERSKIKRLYEEAESKRLAAEAEAKRLEDKGTAAELKRLEEEENDTSDSIVDSEIARLEREIEKNKAFRQIAERQRQEMLAENAASGGIGSRCVKCDGTIKVVYKKDTVQNMCFDCLHALEKPVEEKKKRQPRRRDNLMPIDPSILNEGRKTRSKH